MQWVVVGLLSLVGGFMVFDGARAMLMGDYLTPSSGRYAGQLGPWSTVVRRVGIDPRSVPMKIAFVLIGSFHLLAAVTVASRGETWLALAAALTGLWYLPFGTLSDAVVFTLIVLSSLRPWG